MGFDQQKHPELKKGEIWLTNGDLNFPRDCCFKTLRMGNIACSADGKKNNLHPFFVNKDEHDKHLREYK